MEEAGLTGLANGLAGSHGRKQVKEKVSGPSWATAAKRVGPIGN
jgi:hypothetical protein